MGNLVAVIGRPNVGKSTLFNRITQSRKAIVDPVSGVTRDRHYGTADWNGKSFNIVDTGGYISGSDDVFEEQIRRQVKIALGECDKVIFVVDGTAGITDLDEMVARILRKSNRKIYLAVNKTDTPDKALYTAEFYSLGFGDFFPISAINGSGTGELLDALVADMVIEDDSEKEKLPKITIVGRPNVGKSSFLNALMGEERHVVTPIAGTTRDAIHTHFTSFGFDFLLVDTAGLRKKSKVKEDLEFYSVMRTISAIEDSDVCILMIDATEGFESQDMNIFSLIQKNHKGLVVLVNKWDLVEKDQHTVDVFKDAILKRTAPFKDIPILFVSAITKQRLLKALETAMEVYKNRSLRIPARKLNDYILPIIEKQPPPSMKGKYIQIKFATQLPTYYPSFAFFCNLPQYVKESYQRFLENKLREGFGFTGVPIEIYFRKK